jgi:hypothetical protein
VITGAPSTNLYGCFLCDLTGSEISLLQSEHNHEISLSQSGCGTQAGIFWQHPVLIVGYSGHVGYCRAC